MASIHFENVDLEYPIREGRVTMKEYFLQLVLRRSPPMKRKMVHALHQLTFNIQEGERVGIIGNNGAGKSTLLRTIAGIYPVARGNAEVQGEICSLFDISLGFEPEATGWDNIYFRSYLQGASPAEVKDRIAEIGSFTDLGEFLDLPLRCYSSGMMIRLAFAIATTAEPEILLIDEFFGAGDLMFQKKAEQRMKELIGKAKIVIMVGHNLDYFVRNCQRVLWMEKGVICADGPSKKVVEQYIAHVDAQRRLVTAA